MMNRSVFQSSPLTQQMTEGNSTATGWWNVNGIRQLPLLPSSSPSLASIPYQYPLPSFPWHDTQDLQESWSQLLLEGLVEEDERYCDFNTPSQTKKMENNYWEDQVLLEASNDHMVDVREERSFRRRYLHGHRKEETQSCPAINRCPWNQILPPISSPGSCITSFSSNILEFSNKNGDLRRPKPDNSAEIVVISISLSLSVLKGDSTEVVSQTYKKAKMQGSSVQSSFKVQVRKEKLGDRITTLHQLVSPFGKTDTASVLLEVIGYIKFLQNQIEALSSPYLGNDTSVSKTRNTECGTSEERKDLKSRGLCLVPTSFTMHVVSDNGADYWSPTLAVMFR